MEAIDNYPKPLTTAIIAALLIGTTLCPVAIGAPHVSRSKLVALHPKLAPTPIPLQGRAIVRHPRPASSRHLSRVVSSSVPLQSGLKKGEFTRLAPREDKAKAVALSNRAARGIGQLAANSLRTYTLVRLQPAAVPTAWRAKVADHPKFEFDIMDEEKECTCEAQKAYHLYEEDKFEESRLAYKELAVKSEKAYGYKNVQYASSLMWEGQCLHKLQRDKEAKALWKESLTIYKQYKPKHKAVAWLKKALKNVGE